MNSITGGRERSLFNYLACSQILEPSPVSGEEPECGVMSLLTPYLIFTPGGGCGAGEGSTVEAQTCLNNLNGFHLLPSVADMRMWLRLRWTHIAQFSWPLWLMEWCILIPRGLKKLSLSGPNCQPQCSSQTTHTFCFDPLQFGGGEEEADLAMDGPLGFQRSGKTSYLIWLPLSCATWPGFQLICKHLCLPLPVTVLTYNCLWPPAAAYTSFTETPAFSKAQHSGLQIQTKSSLILP